MDDDLTRIWIAGQAGMSTAVLVPVMSWAYSARLRLLLFEPLGTIF